jgi:biopolymer transport protein ExbB/TolQ
VGILLDYLSHSSAITIFVLGLLSLYIIVTFWIFIERFSLIGSRVNVESKSLKKLYILSGTAVEQNSILYRYISQSGKPTKAILDAASSDVMRESTKGLTWLSIIASTAPFIGLFGTVVGILETFTKLGTASNTSLNVIAPAISEALIATAAGIAVAIFAYTFHLILKRKAYLLSSLLISQSDVILSRVDEGQRDVSLG